MKNLEMGMSLADMFNISATKYKDDLIEELPFTVRQRNALQAANCLTMEQLLNMTIGDLYGIKNLGKTSIDGIIDYITRYDVENICSKETEEKTGKVNCVLRKYTDEILTGKFDEIVDDKIDPNILEKYRSAFEVTEHELLERCVSEPEKINPYIRMLIQWSDHRERVWDALRQIPAYRLENKVIGYFNAYINVNRNWDYSLPNDFDENKTLEDFLKGRKFG